MRVLKEGSDIVSQQVKNFGVFGVVLLGMGSFALSILHREFALPEGECALIQTIRVASAEGDAQDAIEARDFHLYGVGDAKPLVPGLNDQATKDRYSVQPIACSGDTYASPWHLKLIQDSRVYAEHYNAVILRALEEQAPN